MIDVESVVTPEDLRAALRALFQRQHLSYNAVVRRVNDAGGNLGKTTLSNLLDGTTMFPRWDTVKQIVAACAVSGAESAAWERAYRRAREEGVGEPLTEHLDPYDLGVHKAITIGDRGQDLTLTTYVARPHDATLAQVVAAAAGGRSRFVVLLGDSSTGKTRALWEALAPLRQRGGWRLWHPLSPNRRAALDDLGRVRPRTVLWLNESQEYLGGDNRPGDEDAAVALRDLLYDPARAPVLVVGTLWRAYYTELCRPHAAQARDLLDNTATVLEVPSSFHDADPRTLSAVAGSDPRLALAMQRGDGRITQYLAGGPELVRRFERELTVSARAIVQVALDARRMGHRNAIAHSLLAAAAYAYMAPSEWHAVAAESDWFERGLAEAVRPCKGADGPLTRIVPAPLRSRTDRPAGADLSPASAAGPLYLLADYLDQYGRHRAQQIPPIPFWEAASLHAHSHDLTLLGSAAWNRGLYRDAAQLWLNATRHGDITAAPKLVQALHTVDPHDHRAATHVATTVTLDDPAHLYALLNAFTEGGRVDQLHAVAARATTEVVLDDPMEVSRLLRVLNEAGLTDQLHTIATRAATEVPLATACRVAELLDELSAAGLTDLVETLATRAATDTALDSTYGNPAALVGAVSRAALTDQLDTLAIRTAIEVPLDNSFGGLSDLLEALREAELSDVFDSIATRAASEMPLANAANVVLEVLWKAGLTDQVTTLATRIATHAPLDHGWGVAWVLASLRTAGLTDQCDALAARAANNASLAPGSGRVTTLLSALQQTGLISHLRTFATRVATDIDLDDASEMAALIGQLRKAGLKDQLAVLIARSPATEVVLDDASGVAALIGQLRKAGLKDQLAVLIARSPATEVALDKSFAVDALIEELRQAGLITQLDVLTSRLPGIGAFRQFLKLSEASDRFRFGREPTGEPAAPWGWEDLA